MKTQRRRFVGSLTITLAIGAMLGGSLWAGKGGKGSKGGGDSKLAGTIYFQDNAPGFSGPQGVVQVMGMKADGSGKFLALPAGITGPPSSLTYGENGDRWWLTLAKVPDWPDELETAFHTELFAIPPEPGQPDGLEPVQITDLFDSDCGDSENQYPVAIESGWVRWSNDGLDNDGLDSDASFKGHDYRDNTNNIYRLPVKEASGDVFPSQCLPYGLEDLELVLKSSLAMDDEGRAMHVDGFDWSPDGTQLALFVGYTLVDLERDPRPELPVILYVKTVGGDPTDLGSPIWTGVWSYGGWLDWSPDGSRIAFVGWARPDSYGAVWTIAPDGSAADHVLSIKSRDDFRYPCWSPDSKQIALTVIRGFNYPWDKYIATCPAHGGGVTLLTRDLDVATGKAPVAWVP